MALLAKRAGLEVPDSGYSAGAKERREKLLAINKQAARAFHRWLYAPEGVEGWPICSGAACPAGPSPASAWALLPTAGTALIQELGQQGYDKRDLLDAGLAVNNQDGRDL